MANNSFAVDVEKNLIKKYEKKMIASGRLDFLIPMSFVDFGKNERIIYDYTGYEALNNIEEGFDVKSTFNLLEEVLHRLKEAEDYLIDPSKFNLNCTTIYVNREKQKVKLIYLPEKDQEKNLNRNITLLIDDMETKYMSKEAREYLAVIKDCLNRNLGLLELINKIGSIKREAYICGIM